MNAVAECSPLMEAALSYADKGLPVLPCHPQNKTPLVKGGFHSASNDPDRVKA